MPPSRRCEGIGLPAFYIAGPTASGKSDLALALAKACGGEIVGADALQVYAGLDLLSAKPSPEARSEVPHHLIDCVPLGEDFNVARYLALAHPVIEAIRQRGRLPIIVGGTGLYLRALSRGLAEVPPSDPALREQLAAEPLETLLARLKAADPMGFAVIDRRNPRRVIRALEVCLVSGRPFSSFRETWKESPPLPGVVLEWERAHLHQRIEERTHQMFNAGVVAEVARTGPVSETAQQMIGWAPIQKHLRGEIDEAACQTAILHATRQYARRQLIWLRREPGLTPFPMDAPMPQLVERLLTFLPDVDRLS